MVTDKNGQYRLRNLSNLLHKLRNSLICLGLKQYCFMQDFIGYLRHLVEKQRIRGNPKKVDAIQQVTMPKDKKALGAFQRLMH